MFIKLLFGSTVAPFSPRWSCSYTQTLVFPSQGQSSACLCFPEVQWAVAVSVCMRLGVFVPEGKNQCVRLEPEVVG